MYNEKSGFKIKPKVSVIVPFYNGKKYIKRLVNLCEMNFINLTHEYPECLCELIIINDSPSINIDNIKISIGHIKIVYNHDNIGIHGTKIKGLNEANGDFIVFLDQDDIISSRYLLEQYKIIGDCDAAVCNAEWGYGPKYTKNSVEALNIETYKKGENGIVSLGQVLLRKNSIPIEWTNNILYCNGADDYFLMFLLLLKKKKMVEHRKTLYYHVNTGENFSNSVNNIGHSVIETADILNKLNLISENQSTKIKDNWHNKMSDNCSDSGIYIKRSEMLDIWMNNLENNIDIYSYLKTFGIKKVALYGAGHFGRRLAYWGKKSSIAQVCFIDRDAASKCELLDLNVIDIDQAQKNQNKFDAIIVTPFVDEYIITDKLIDIFNCIIIPIFEVVINASCTVVENVLHQCTNKYYVNINGNKNEDRN